jgi:peptide chain release factor 2
VVLTADELKKGLLESQELLELALSENELSLLNDLRKDLDSIEKRLSNLEFQRMFNGKFDANNAYVEINSGSGGTEAQDWAEMLLRMYLKFAANQGFTAEVTDYMAGEVAGLKNACIYVTGEYAYGWLRTETGVHRLVRKSPFDSGNRRHTSFASVYVSPEINDDIDIEINPADLRVDTYRASGAGGQHVNRTDSAIRITHIPTGIVVQCQSDRSQHKNRSTAMNQLKGKLYDLELQKRNQELQKSEESKAENGWGSQIRSYVLDQSRIKDLRTGVEAGDTGKVLDGDLEKFIRASLQLGA